MSLARRPPRSSSTTSFPSEEIGEKKGRVSEDEFKQIVTMTLSG